MGMLNDIFVNAKVIVNKVGEKTNDVCDIAKLNALKGRIKKDAYNVYEELGRKYYSLYRKGDIELADFTEELEELDDLHAQYDNVLKQIEDAKNVKRCPVCNSKQNNDNTFCAECGAEFE